MRHLFATTALAVILSMGVAQAQDTSSQPAATTTTTGQDATQPMPAITPPEGYVEGDVVLTTDNLQGASVYDASGDEIGEVHGLVFANGSNSLGGAAGSTAPATGMSDPATTSTTGMETGAASDTAMTGTDTAGTDTTGAGTDSAATGADMTDSTGATDTATGAAGTDATTATDSSAGTGASTDMAADTGTDTAPDATEDATNTVDSGTASPEASAPGMDTDSANVASGTDQGDSDRVEPAGSDTAATTPAMTPSGQTETTAATTDTDATTGTAATADAPAGGQTQAMDSAEISHAIIDVGGFLGMGEHRVAVPVGDLVVYQKDDDIRIYLPWTREQLEALPEFDEDAAAATMQ